MTDDKKSKRRSTRKRTSKPKPDLSRDRDRHTKPVEPPSKRPAAEPAADTEPPSLPPSAPASRDDEPTARASLASSHAKPDRVLINEGVRPLDRDQVFEAVYLEALEGGMSTRWATAAADDVCDRLRLGGHREAAPDTGFYDLRGEQDYKYPRNANKVLKKGKSVVMRDPSTIDTIVVHQTACEFGVSRRAIKLADGDVELARARRALDVACHALAFRGGYFVAAHPLLAYVHHAGRDNAPSLCLEVEGRYCGIQDDPTTVAREDLKSTWGGEPTELTDQAVESALAALGWLVVEGRALECPLTKIKTHRQSSDTRRSDPGEEIFKRVVLFGAELYDLEVVYESRTRVGRPVPVQWDPVNGIGEY